MYDRSECKQRIFYMETPGVKNTYHRRIEKSLMECVMKGTSTYYHDCLKQCRHGGFVEEAKTYIDFKHRVVKGLHKAIPGPVPSLMSVVY